MAFASARLEGVKTCTRCSELKGANDFYSDKRTGALRAACKACMAVDSNEWRSKNRERALEIQRQSALKRRLRERGVDAELHTLLVARSGGQCEICGASPGGLKTMLSIDHCHETGRVRGLLCDSCNIGIGYFNDDPRKLAAAIRYLAHREDK